MSKPNYGFTDANVLKPKTDNNTPMEDIALLINRAKQIGCGYCYHESNCEEHDPKINKAKLGCKKFNHWENKK